MDISRIDSNHSSSPRFFGDIVNELKKNKTKKYIVLVREGHFDSNTIFGLAILKITLDAQNVGIAKSACGANCYSDTLEIIEVPSMDQSIIKKINRYDLSYNMKDAQIFGKDALLDLIRYIGDYLPFDKRYIPNFIKYVCNVKSSDSFMVQYIKSLNHKWGDTCSRHDSLIRAVKSVASILQTIVSKYNSDEKLRIAILRDEYNSKDGIIVAKKSYPVSVVKNYCSESKAIIFHYPKDCIYIAEIIDPDKYQFPKRWVGQTGFKLAKVAHINGLYMCDGKVVTSSSFDACYEAATKIIEK